MLTGSIVLYNNDKEMLNNAVNSFLNIPVKKSLYLIDNSPTDQLKNVFVSDEITYIHNKKNIGFGKAHNQVINDLIKGSKYHLILNPDTYFSQDVLPILIERITQNENIGLIAPKILYPNGNFQNSIRKFPKIHDFLLRRISFLSKLFKNEYKKGNYLDISISNPMFVEAVSGCFQLFKTSVFVKINGFDPRYFMYMEDIDICRKVRHEGYKVLYDPNAIVYHHSDYGSKKKLKLLVIHVVSIFKYYWKWNLHHHKN